MAVKTVKKPVAKTVKKTGLVITTSHKGVFFGYGVDAPGAKEIKLTDVRMCIYWPTSNKGVLGLAVSGPQSGSKVTQAVPAMTVKDVTAVMSCTDDAIKAWEKGPWN